MAETIELAVLGTDAAGGHRFPDIGTDPMKGDRVDRIEQSVAACREAYAKQQKGVPDQTALVWRWHLGALLECATRLNAILSRTDATQTREAELPKDVRALVIAAREFWDDENSGTVRSHALDKALEAFSSRVPYDDQPRAALNARGGA